MVSHHNLYSGTSPNSAGTNIPSSKSTGTNLPSFNSTKLTGTNLPGSKSTGTNLPSFKSARSSSVATENNEFQHLLAQLHAELLSALLSLSQAPALSTSCPAAITDSLNSDDVAMIVAALIAFSSRPDVDVGGGTVRNFQGGEEGRGECEEVKGDKMEECVERFAQFLQISMSGKVLQLESGEFWTFVQPLVLLISFTCV